MQNPNLKLLAEYGKRIKELNVYGALPEGYYLIDKVAVTVKNGFETIDADAKWHPRNKEVKPTDYPISINLSGLRKKVSDGPKEFNFNEAKGITIHIKSCTTHESEYEGKLKQQPKFEWSIISFGDQNTIV